MIPLTTLLAALAVALACTVFTPHVVFFVMTLPTVAIVTLVFVVLSPLLSYQPVGFLTTILLATITGWLTFAIIAPLFNYEPLGESFSLTGTLLSANIIIAAWVHLIQRRRIWKNLSEESLERIVKEIQKNKGDALSEQQERIIKEGLETASRKRTTYAIIKTEGHLLWDYLNLVRAMRESKRDRVIQNVIASTMSTRDERGSLQRAEEILSAQEKAKTLDQIIRTLLEGSSSAPPLKTSEGIVITTGSNTFEAILPIAVGSMIQKEIVELSIQCVHSEDRKLIQAQARFRCTEEENPDDKAKPIKKFHFREFFTKTPEGYKKDEEA